MKNRDEVLAEIVTLAHTYGLTSKEISEALKSQEAGVHGESKLVASILGYIGGILVFAGVGVYTMTFWDELSSLLRILITLGSGLSCYLIALGLSGDRRYAQATNALFLVSSFLQPLGLFVMLNELFERSTDDRIPVMFVFGVMLLQQAATFWEKRLTVLLFMTLLFGFDLIFVSFDYLGMRGDFISIGAGASLFFVTYALRDSPYRGIMGFWYFISSVAFLSGFFSLLQHRYIDFLFVGISCFVVYLSVVVKSRALLFSGTAGLLGFIGYYTVEHFAHSVGWPVTLILIGLAFIGISGSAFKIQQRYLKGR